MATSMFILVGICMIAMQTNAGPTCANMTIYNDTSCTMPAFKWTDETTPEACCNDCHMTPGCLVWELALSKSGHHQGNCHLKTSDGKLQHQPGTTCGRSTTLPPRPGPPEPTPPAPPLPPAPPAPPGSPNIIWILTDDQDQKLGGSFPMHNGVGPMPKTKKALADVGATATNWFIHTPICCPSRSELVTGRYFHNLKKTGGGCMHIDEDQVNNQTFALYLHNQGYTVGMFGKYLNNNPTSPPPGIDAYMTNGGGDYMSPQFDTKGVSDLAPYYMKDGGWQGNRSDYTTAVVGNVSLSWLETVVAGPRPFFAYVAPKACHEPFTPAPWYADHWDPLWPTQEPRPVSWNCSFESRANHHGNVATNKMITEQCADYVTTSFKNRWRSLMSVDDVIESLVSFVEQKGIADNTYILYSSDHGFQLGEFNILIDKRQPYDHDTRIHLLIRGPGIKANSSFPYLGTNVDIAPTWLGLAGVAKPSGMDGRSIAPLVIDVDDENVPAQTVKHIKALAPHGQAPFQQNWRDSVFIEYYYNDPNSKCTGYPTEDIHNNFIGIRHLEGSEFGDTAYYEFQSGDQKIAPGIQFDKLDFVEFYNISSDMWQMNNLWKDPLQNFTQAKLHTKLHMWYDCKGNSCP